MIDWFNVPIDEIYARFDKYILCQVMYFTHKCIDL